LIGLSRGRLNTIVSTSAGDLKTVAELKKSRKKQGGEILFFLV